jgi:single-stranded DNA-binding protein
MKYLSKGSKITVSGRGKLRTYDKKDGTQGQSLELDVQDFTLPAKQQEEVF